MLLQTVFAVWSLQVFDLYDPVIGLMKCTCIVSLHICSKYMTTDFFLAMKIWKNLVLFLLSVFPSNPTLTLPCILRHIQLSRFLEKQEQQVKKWNVIIIVYYYWL